jgi:tetratricopeptide (TPR) repeat protein
VSPNPRIDEHPGSGVLARFGRGELTRTENRRIIRHLVAGCGRCLRFTSRFLPLVAEPVALSGAEGASGAEYTEAFRNACRVVRESYHKLATERDEAPERLERLLGLPQQEATALALTEAQFRTWGVCEALLGRARALGYQDPSRSLALGRLGARIAEALDPDRYGAARILDLQGRAWGLLGNAQRILSDFREAERSFAEAEKRLARGTGDPVEKADLLLFKASLRGNQQRFREAFQLLDRVSAIGRRCGDRHLVGKSLITRGFIVGVANEHEAAIRLLREGLSLVDPTAEPRLAVAAHHNLILYLFEGGREEDALELLGRARPLYERIGDGMALLRLRWLEGKIALALGEGERAESILLDVRKELVEQSIGYDAALLSLDLARIYARQGRGAEMRRLAEEMIPIFQSRDIHREAIAALVVFQRAAEMERVTVGLVQELTDYLQQCRTGAPVQSRPAGT